jgi:hypothetical protein
VLFLPLDPGFGSGIRDGTKSRSGSGMNIPNLIFLKLNLVLWVKNTFFGSDRDQGSFNLGFGIRDVKHRIPDPG